jgi:hypothetical protein
MLKIISVIGSISLLLLLGSCGESEEVQTSDAADTQVDEVVPEPVDEVVEEGPLYPEGTLDPAVTTADMPIAASSLYEAYFAWDGMQVTLTGYPFIWYGDSTVIEDEIRLVADPESTDELATAFFAEPLNRTVLRGEILAVQGTLDMSWTGDIEIAEAAIVEPPAVIELLETSPWVYDGTTPIPVDQFFELFNAWMGKEVTVEGYYHSTTTSVTDYGTTIRVDLSHPDDTYTKYVACKMDAEIPAASDESMVNNREGVQIRGTVTGESFDMVCLEGCTLVNR